MSEEALLMLLIADHILNLFGLARGPGGAPTGEKTFEIEGDLKSWNAFGHLGRILAASLHTDAHGGGHGPVNSICDEWIRVTTQYCMVGLDRTSAGESLRDKVPSAAFSSLNDSLLAERMAEANLRVGEEFTLGQG